MDHSQLINRHEKECGFAQYEQKKNKVKMYNMATKKINK